MNSYPDYGSPVRKARELARSELPCQACGFDGEPALRRPRPYSREWRLDPGTYFGCPACGNALARLSGPAANRPADVSEDHLPDPAGMIEMKIQPAVSAAGPGARREALTAAAADLAGEHGLGFRAGETVCLSWRGQPWLELDLDRELVVTR